MIMHITEETNAIIGVLRRLAIETGGRDIRYVVDLKGDVSVAFSMELGGSVDRFEYVVVDDRIRLKQLSGKDQGQESEVATLSALLSVSAVA